MQLTQHTDIGLRILIALARGDGTPLALPVFARDQQVSYNHVAKIAQALVHSGLIASVRGRNGGIRLARPAEGIRLGEAIRQLEPGMKLADCGRCMLRSDCRLSCILGEALAAFLAVLDRYTLAEAAAPGFPAFSPWLQDTLPSEAGTGPAGVN